MNIYDPFSKGRSKNLTLWIFFRLVNILLKPTFSHGESSKITGYKGQKITSYLKYELSLIIVRLGGSSGRYGWQKKVMKYPLIPHLFCKILFISMIFHNSKWVKHRNDQITLWKLFLLSPNFCHSNVRKICQKYFFLYFARLWQMLLVWTQTWKFGQ